MQKNDFSGHKTMRLSHKALAQLAELKAYHKSNKAWLEAAIEKQWNKIFNPTKGKQ
jgi:hypothetical protein